MAKRPAFGYMRVERGASAAESADLRQRMADFVTELGFALSEVFVESEDSTSSAFALLIDALHASDVTVVVIPSMSHLAHMAGVSAAMKERIEIETSAHVVIAAAAIQQRRCAG